MKDRTLSKSSSRSSRSERKLHDDEDDPRPSPRFSASSSSSSSTKSLTSRPSIHANSFFNGSPPRSRSCRKTPSLENVVETSSEFHVPTRGSKEYGDVHGKHSNKHHSNKNGRLSSPRLETQHDPTERPKSGKMNQGILTEHSSKKPSSRKVLADANSNQQQQQQQQQTQQQRPKSVNKYGQLVPEQFPLLRRQQLQALQGQSSSSSSQLQTNPQSFRQGQTNGTVQQSATEPAPHHNIQQTWDSTSTMGSRLGTSERSNMSMSPYAIKKNPSKEESILSCDSNDSHRACLEERIVAKLYNNGRQNLYPSSSQTTQTNMEGPREENRQGQWVASKGGGSAGGPTSACAQTGVILSNNDSYNNDDDNDSNKWDGGKDKKNRQHKDFDEQSRSDSLTTVPNPPSLAERSYVRLPGAFRMTSDGFGPRRPQIDTDTASSHTNSFHEHIIEAHLVNDSARNSAEDWEVPPPTSSPDYIESMGGVTYATTTTSSPVVEGTPVDDRHAFRQLFKSRVVQCGICCLLVVFAVLAIGTAYGITGFEKMEHSENNRNSDPPTMNPTTAGDVDLEYFVNVALPKYTREALSDDQSHQARALDWLISTPAVLLESYPLYQRLQRFALATIFLSTKGSGWRFSQSWFTLDDECDWFSSATDTSSICKDGEYSTLSLIDNLLDNQIPMEIGLLTSLTYLNFQSNFLTGPLPTSIGACTKLQEIRLVENFLSGSIPEEIGALTDLEFLELAYNVFAQKIPRSIGSLTKLQHLLLDRNFLAETIPSDFGKLINLREINLYSNFLTGEIPHEIGHLSSLETLNLSNNFLETLPTTIGNLTNLREISLDRNDMLGSIPSEIGNIHPLETLLLYENLLFGPLPSEFRYLTNLKLLALNENKLSGTIPTHIGLWSDLDTLILGNNTFSGTIPTEVGTLQELKMLDLFFNYFTGTVPTEIGQLEKISIVALERNFLNGTLPTELGRLKNITQFWIFNNMMSGTIPTEIGSWTSLEVLSLSRNFLTGSIPTEVGLLSNLGILSVAMNQLSGRIPSEIGKLTKLTRMELHDNYFTGQVPDEVCAMVASGQIARNNFILNCSTIVCNCCQCL